MMKTTLRIRRGSLASAVATLLLVGPAGAAELHFEVVANELATTFLQQKSRTDDDLAAFLAGQAIIADSAFAKDVAVAVKLGRDIEKNGPKAGSAIFARLLHNNHRAPEDATPAPSGPTAKSEDPKGATPTAPTAATEPPKISQLIRERKKQDLAFDSSRHQVFFHLGSNILNPYQLTKNADAKTIALDPAPETATGTFLEFVYTNRLAWNAARIKALYDEVHSCPADGENDRDWRAKNWFTHWDVQARIGYNFAKDSDLNANTLVGSGSFNAELDVSFPSYFRSFQTGAFSIGPEVSYGVTTDRSAMSSHGRLFAGIGYSTAIDDPLGLTAPKDAEPEPTSKAAIATAPRRVLLHMRIGQAQIDSVRFKGPDTREIFTTNDLLPKYHKEWAWAFESELLYPLNKSSFLTFGARVYPDVNPSPWSLSVGLTTPLAGIADAIIPK